MTGAEFRKMMAEEDSESKKLKVERLRVLARSSPQDKQVLVKFLQQQGQVVAATGDGTNDAPALKAADVGIAMFLSGTAVCKSAAESEHIKNIETKKRTRNEKRKWAAAKTTVLARPIDRL